jgi:hypothetical protein
MERVAEEPNLLYFEDNNAAFPYIALMNCNEFRVVKFSNLFVTLLKSEGLNIFVDSVVG